LTRNKEIYKCSIQAFASEERYRTLSSDRVSGRTRLCARDTGAAGLLGRATIGTPSDGIRLIERMGGAAVGANEVVFINNGGC
jgi:hypothetical protein